MFDIPRPYLLFLADASDLLAAKTARGLAYWRPDWCVGQHRMPGAKADLGLPDLTLEEAVARGARTMIVGVANAGGVMSPEWLAVLAAALEAGMDLANGLHDRLNDVPLLRDTARRCGRRMYDVRHADCKWPVGNCLPRSGKRVLTVGTDTTIGKMHTALWLEREMRARGMKADFRATGQTGLLIAGGGVALDAIAVDFVSGAAELLSPANDPDHWDVVEGQSSLFHPSYAGLSLGLMWGTQPDAIVMCHDPVRPHLRGRPHRPMPDLAECIAFNLQCGRMSNPRVRCAGVSLNMMHVPPSDRERILAATEARVGVPCVDPETTGVGRIVDVLAGI